MIQWLLTLKTHIYSWRILCMFTISNSMRNINKHNLINRQRLKWINVHTSFLSFVIVKSNLKIQLKTWKIREKIQSWIKRQNKNMKRLVRINNKNKRSKKYMLLIFRSIAVYLWFDIEIVSRLNMDVLFVYLRPYVLCSVNIQGIIIYVE